MGAPAPLLTFDQHLEGLAEATGRLTDAARVSWLGATVPTCPGWTMLDLLAHTGMVHRWATAALRGDRASMDDSAAVEVEGRTHTDPVGWLENGSAALGALLAEVPEDVAAPVFLKEAPLARDFWARRQCHETVMHAVDASAAALGRAPAAGEVWVGADLALDGIDELLVGFWQRSRSGPRSPLPRRVLVAPVEGDLGWLVTTGPDRCTTRRFSLAQGSGPVDQGPTTYEVDAVVSGSAPDLYLALWNRGGDVRDPSGVLDDWAEQAAVRWS